MDRQTDKCTDITLYILVDILHHSTKLHLCTPSQSKAILAHVNSTDYPLDGPKMDPMTLPLWLPQVHPLHMCL